MTVRRTAGPATGCQSYWMRGRFAPYTHCSKNQSRSLPEAASIAALKPSVVAEDAAKVCRKPARPSKKASSPTT